MRMLLLRAIRGYQQAISPSLGVACRYEPTCSHYAYEAIDRHGAWRGLGLAVRRLSRCRPGGGGGYDPVPDTDAGADTGAGIGVPARADGRSHVPSTDPRSSVTDESLR